MLKANFQKMQINGNFIYKICICDFIWKVHSFQLPLYYVLSFWASLAYFWTFLPKVLVLSSVATVPGHFCLLRSRFINVPWNLIWLYRTCRWGFFPFSCSWLFVHHDAETLRELVFQFPKVFSSKMGLTYLLEYETSLKDQKPVRLPPYCLLPLKMHILWQHTDLMLEKGFHLTIALYS